MKRLLLFFLLAGLVLVAKAVPQTDEAVAALHQDSVRLLVDSLIRELQEVKIKELDMRSKLEGSGHTAHEDSVRKARQRQRIDSLRSITPGVPVVVQGDTLLYIYASLGGEDAVNNNYMKTISSVVDYRSDVQYTDYTGTATHGRRRTSAIDLAKYAEHLYKDYTGNKDLYQPLIDDLCNTEYNWGVPGGVPSGVTVAHKVGFNTTYYANNDVGIVFGTEDYVLAVMTESGDAKAAQQIIGEVSRMIYEYVESNYA